MKEQIISNIEQMDTSYEMADGSAYNKGSKADKSITVEFEALSSEDKVFVVNHFSATLDKYKYTKIGKALSKHY